MWKRPLKEASGGGARGGEGVWGGGGAEWEQSGVCQRLPYIAQIYPSRHYSVSLLSLRLKSLVGQACSPSSCPLLLRRQSS